MSEQSLTNTTTAAQPLPGEGMIIYVLSRETAKLGHALTPGATLLQNRYYCPSCGGRITEPLEKLAAQRLTCSHVLARPQNGAARLAEYFAAHLVTVFPGEDVVASLCRGRIQKQLLATTEKVQKAAQSKGTGIQEFRNNIWQTRALDTRYGETIFERLVRELTRLLLAAYRRDAKHSSSNQVSELSKTLHLLFLSAEGELRETLLTRTVTELYQVTAADPGLYGLGKDLRQQALELLLLAHNPETANWKETVSSLKALKLDVAGDLWNYFDTTHARLLREREEAKAVQSGLVTLASVVEKRQQARTQVSYYSSTKDWHWYSINAATGSVEKGEKRAGEATNALAALTTLAGLARYAYGRSWWKERSVESLLVNPNRCGEFLYQATANPRRYPLARYILKHRRKLFDLLVLDEAHEFAGDGSAQQKAAHRLVELPGTPTLALTGSLMGGYSSSLFTNFWSLSRPFRREFGREDKQQFINRYGYRKVFVTKSDDGKDEPTAKVTGFGSVTDREERAEDYSIRVLGEAPGVLPLFILKHLLPQAVLVSKEDVTELPSQVETRVPIIPSQEDKKAQELLTANRELQRKVVEAIRYDMLNSPELVGKLWGAMSELVFYPDLASVDSGNQAAAEGKRTYQVCYPENCGGGLVALGKVFPAYHITPKERWMLDKIREELAEGRKVLVFLRHTGQGGHLVKRLTRLIKEELGETAAYLDSAKVSTKTREAWIDREVIGRGCKVLLLNPNTVKTGLNNLVWFSTGIWYELDYNAITYRQANGRLHRIGQTQEVRIFYPYYANTAQEIAVTLLAKKVGASLQVDGLDMESALEAAGATAGDGGNYLSGQIAMNMGRAIYEMLII